MAIHCGLDFGTSNSVISVMNGENSFTVNFPSLLFFPDDEFNIRYCIGDEARDEYLAQNMKGRFVKSIKSILPKSSFSYTMINGKKFTAPDLVRLILGRLKERVEEQAGLNLDSVTLGRPVYFSDNSYEDEVAEQRLIEAAKMAGFSSIRLQLEPIAAAYDYFSEAEREQTIIVGDIGGGTSDFTVITMSKSALEDGSDKKNFIKAVSGVHVGGDDFDTAIMKSKLLRHFGYRSKYKSNGQMLDFPAYLTHSISNWENIFTLRQLKTLEDLKYIQRTSDNKEAVANIITLIDKNLCYSLFQSIAAAKHSLTENDLSRIIFNEAGISLDEELKESEFRASSAADVREIGGAIDEALKRAGLKEVDIDVVVLTGGSTYVRSVYELFVNRFGREKVHRRDAFKSVARGLALDNMLSHEAVSL